MAAIFVNGEILKTEIHASVLPDGPRRSGADTKPRLRHDNPVLHGVFTPGATIGRTSTYDKP